MRGRRGKRGEKENTGQEERRKEDEEEKETSRSRCRAGGEKVKAVTGERGKAVVMVTKKMRKQEWKKKVMKRGRSFEKVCVERHYETGLRWPSKLQVTSFQVDLCPSLDHTGDGEGSRRLQNFCQPPILEPGDISSRGDHLLSLSLSLSLSLLLGAMKKGKEEAMRRVR